MNFSPLGVDSLDFSMLPTPLVEDIDYERVYEPAEDTFLLLDCFEEEAVALKEEFGAKGPVVCEIGTGSGMVSTFIKKNVVSGASIAGDMNPYACEAAGRTARANGVDIDVVRMDLASGFRDGCVDILVFNPPYVPSEEVPEEVPGNTEWLDLALLGGHHGMDVTRRLLGQLDRVLSETGRAYVLFSARNHPDVVARDMIERGWHVETVITRKAGWEVLSVLKFERPKR